MERAGMTLHKGNEARVGVHGYTESNPDLRG
jgi:hypothetical protein